MNPSVKAALTSATAWQRASAEVRALCLEHIDDAQNQVMGAKDKEQRRLMLSRLPKHIRDIVEERLRALWTGSAWGRVVFASDNSDDAYHDACVYLEQTCHPDSALRRLPVNGVMWVVV